MESSFRKNHMVGILPLSPHSSNLKMPWPDYLLHIGENFCILKSCVHECLLAGCDSIWVVCNDNTSPIVRKVIGDYVLCPEGYYDPSSGQYSASYERFVPIFYTPMEQKYRNIESLGWSVLSGALTSFKVCSRISKWVRPSKYYVSFPYSVYDLSIVAANKSKIRSKDLFFLSFNEQTVKENLQTGFSFAPRHWIRFKKNVKDNCTGADRSLPLEERWSSSKFTLDKIFNCDIIEEVQNTVEVSNYVHFDSWESVKEYYKNENNILPLEKGIIGPYFK